MAVKNSQRFAEIERLMGDYFGCHLAPVMGRVQRDLSNRQADEMRAYSNSTAGILRSLATANMPGDDPYATLKITGKWNSKTTEDYLAMCKEAIVGNKDMQRDLAVMAEEWRKAVVTEIGRERYDALSKQLGCDLAYAYIDHRMEQLMIEKMVKDRMPTSSADYIIRKAAQSSLFGLPYELNKSPLAAEIEAKGEAAYKPSRTEKAAGWAAGAGADVVEETHKRTVCHERNNSLGFIIPEFQAAYPYKYHKNGHADQINAQFLGRSGQCQQCKKQFLQFRFHNFYCF